MGQLSALLRDATGPDANGYRALVFRCPGCEEAHILAIARAPDQPGPTWSYNGNPEKPTFQPSVLVTTIKHKTMTDQDFDDWDALVAKVGTDVAMQDPRFRCVCHSFVTDGRIQFLGDCTHAMANQTADLLAWPQELET